MRTKSSLNYPGDREFIVGERDDEDWMPRPSGCICTWEEGDSPCPVHGLDEEGTNEDDEDDEIGGTASRRRVRE